MHQLVVTTVTLRNKQPQALMIYNNKYLLLMHLLAGTALLLSSRTHMVLSL